MKAYDFWVKFQENICENKELIENWNNSKKFTNAIMKKIEDQILKKDTLENIVTEREYFRIDLISYIDTSKTKCLHNSLQNCSWNLICAVEHENDYRLWVDEVVKLAHISCPLRVVIGYLPKEKETLEQTKFSKYLDKVSKLLNNIESWKHTRNSGDFLIIIGDCKLSTTDKKCVYTPFLYRNGSFINMSGKTNWR